MKLLLSFINTRGNKKQSQSRCRGFTLIELLVVIAIIAVLAAIVLASLNTARTKSQIAAILQFDSHNYGAMGDSLIGQWQFDEMSGVVANDTSSFSHNGTISGATYVTGIAKGALNFNGTSNSVSVGNLGTFPSKGTLSFLMYPTNIASYRNPLTTNWGGLNKGIRFEENDAGVFGVVVGDDGGTYLGHNFTSQLKPNTWYQITVTWDTSINNIKGYLNGKKVFDDSHTLWPTTIPNLYIGVGFASSRYYQGYLDQVRLYSTSF